MAQNFLYHLTFPKMSLVHKNVASDTSLVIRFYFRWQTIGCQEYFFSSVLIVFRVVKLSARSAPKVKAALPGNTLYCHTINFKGVTYMKIKFLVNHKLWYFTIKSIWIKFNIKFFLIDRIGMILHFDQISLLFMIKVFIGVLFYIMLSINRTFVAFLIEFTRLLLF